MVFETLPGEYLEHNREKEHSVLCCIEFRRQNSKSPKMFREILKDTGQIRETQKSAQEGYSEAKTALCAIYVY